MDRLQKCVEQLKSLLAGDDTKSSRKRDSGPAAVARDKIALCRAILQLVNHASVREHSDYGASFGTVAQMLLALSDDANADVRLVAEETLVATLRWSVCDGYASRAHFELYRSLRSQSAGGRCTKLALRSFAHIAPAVRPGKSAVYAHNMAPCLAALLAKPDELVHEALSSCAPTILAVLGRYLNDDHCKVDIAFLQAYTA